ncbi:hypothetical protein [Rubellicoccus peritrichatus]|uniref:Uncharacterized protein n=1 Tax=Rubellicoccus peritrichatus TaxID=3080537 RepID=A0AAQ3LFM8_9BACT|nr:hypothetical protein [Puniceicoccus sp. CR14]WOO41179.1 hypothetical protein RZN69_21370 [Puniceicoccus sp. CR14]
MKAKRPDTVNAPLDLSENARKIAIDYFDPMLPSGQEWFTPKEVAAMIGRSDQYVRDCLKTGRILGHQFDGKGGNERRRGRYQIHREGLALFLLETANYKPGDIAERLTDTMKRRSEKVPA